jgi:hypothetical protein
MQLRDALAQVSEIRLQLDRAATFRGFRARPTAFSALAACCAALLQPWLVAEPAKDPQGYVALWVVAATACLAVALFDLALGFKRAPSFLTGRLAARALEQLAPTLVAGALLTLVIMRHASDAAWMLPGLWSVLFSLGLFAAGRLLPRAIMAVGAWYLACGIFCLAWFQNERAFSAWSMGLTFGLGQLLTAGILYFTLERGHERVAP